MNLCRALVVLLCTAVTAGCAGSKSEQKLGAPAGERAKPDAFLAYEHTVSIRYGSDVVAAREDSLRKACSTEQFGACSLISIGMSQGTYADGHVVLRVAPDAVEPLVKLAADGGELTRRETRAEDLAEAVAQTQQSRELLSRQRQNFERLQERRDVPVADQLALARELAALEVALDTNEKTAAQQRRRIETNLLTFELHVRDEPSKFGRISHAFDDMGDSFSEGIAATVEAIGYGVPLLVLAFIAALLWRWVWRKVTRVRG